MSNPHFGKLGDVWKHLLLAEILRSNPPADYWETHAGSAFYILTNDEPRKHGVIHFMQHAPSDPLLAGSAYLKILRSTPGRYSGSPALALRVLGEKARYLFCDTDTESARDIRAAIGSLNGQVVEHDGMATVGKRAQLVSANVAEIFICIDPFEPHERLSSNDPSSIELAGILAARGFRVFYWYGYDTKDRRGWAYEAIRKFAQRAKLWCGDFLIPSPFVYPERAGAWGCGVVLANMTDAETDLSFRLGEALERISRDDSLPDNDPVGLSFALVSLDNDTAA